MWRTMSFMIRSSRTNSSQLGWGKGLIYFSILFSFVLLMASCSKPAGEIGAVIQPEDSKLNVFWNDTTTVYAYSEPEDSVRSDNLSRNLLGSTYDETFGNTTIGFFVQFVLTASGHDFGENAQVDSVVLQLKYTGESYGDTSTLLTAHAFELMEMIDNDSIYFSNLNLETGDIDYANFEWLPLPNDSVVVEEDTLTALIRIPLNNNPELGEKLINAGDAMEDTEAFQEYFNGLHIVTSPLSNGGSILYFDLVNNISRMTLYYSNDEQEALRYEYMITSDVARVGKYDHNYENGSASFSQQVFEGDTALGQERFYVQGMGGIMSYIKLPNIQKYSHLGVIAVNEAKLILPGAEADPLYGTPFQLALYTVQEDGSFGYLPDLFEGDEYFGGFYHSSSNSYTFRITRYVQDLISNPTKVDYGIGLFVNNPWVFPERFIFNGNKPVSDTASRFKLEILYTKLD